MSMVMEEAVSRVIHRRRAISVKLYFALSCRIRSDCTPKLAALFVVQYVLQYKSSYVYSAELPLEGMFLLETFSLLIDAISLITEVVKKRMAQAKICN